MPSGHDQSLVWDMVMKVGKNAENECLHLDLLDFFDFFSLQPGEHGHSIVLQHVIDTGVHPAAPTADSTVEQKSPATYQRYVNERHNSTFQQPLFITDRKEEWLGMILRQLNAVKKKKKRLPVATCQ